MLHENSVHYDTYVTIKCRHSADHASQNSEVS